MWRRAKIQARDFLSERGQLARFKITIFDLERNWELFWGVMGVERNPFSLSV